MKIELRVKSQITNNAKETQEVAAKFATQILRLKPSKTSVILVLSGELGSGKTTFLQGFAKGLNIKNKITSPTFIIYKKFSIPLDPQGIPKADSQFSMKSKILNSKFNSS